MILQKFLKLPDKNDAYQKKVCMKEGGRDHIIYKYMVYNLESYCNGFHFCSFTEREPI